MPLRYLSLRCLFETLFVFERQETCYEAHHPGDLPTTNYPYASVVGASGHSRSRSPPAAFTPGWLNGASG